VYLKRPVKKTKIKIIEEKKCRKHMFAETGFQKSCKGSLGFMIQRYGLMTGILQERFS